MHQKYVSPSFRSTLYDLLFGMKGMTLVLSSFLWSTYPLSSFEIVSSFKEAMMKSYWCWMTAEPNSSLVTEDNRLIKSWFNGYFAIIVLCKILTRSSPDSAYLNFNARF